MPITRIEYMITSHCLERYLPGTGLVLDAGSGPGRYAIDLARKNYRVAMFDLVREMLQLARVKVAHAGLGRRSTTLVEGDIAALPYADRAFDAVISLGAPLSHLTDLEARTRAVGEMARVLKADGVLFLTGCTRLACYRGTVYWLLDSFFEQILTAQDRARGIIHGSQTWYNFGPGELEDLARGAGLEILEVVGCEGLASYLPMDHLERVEADPQRWSAWKEILLETCNEPSIVGISNHLMVVAHKSSSH